MYYTNVLQWLEASADRAPQKAAFADPQGEITFADLVERARGIGGILMKKAGIGDPVAFYMEKSVEAVCGMFGAVYAGGFYSFIDVRQPVPRAQKILDVLRPRVLITDEKNCAKARELHFQGEILDIHQLTAAADPADQSEEELRAQEAALRSIRREMTDGLPLYVNFTSGSTGLPKGVAVSHRSVIEFISHFADGFGIRQDDVIANQAPFDFDVSVKDIYSGLLTGAKVQIIPREYFSAPTQLMDYLSDKKVTVLIWAVSAMCFVSIMNGLAYKTPSTVRLVMFSGEVMPIKQLNKWRQYLPDAVYVNLYGPTEITCNCTYYVLKKDHEYALTDVIPAGKAFPNEKVFLLDEEDHEVTPDQPGKEGEICVCGTSVALGYYRDPERTKAAFMQNPLNADYEERMYRTGDIGKYDSDGNIVYVSRRDFQIKHLGHRIELGEIEADAMSRDGVSRACCIYDRDKKRLILFYTGEREKKDLETELKEALPPFMFPNKVIQLSDMPLNKNGKIDRHALEDIYHQK
ncbi:MAG: amino acid adenylation domain-containing protein [Lachnospiraceae bacterium]|nr:amino acid adenylation domain-containing protein [Lachnospiraceae bacterium]